MMLFSGCNGLLEKAHYCCVRNRSLVHSFTNPHVVYGGWVDYIREEWTYSDGDVYTARETCAVEKTYHILYVHLYYMYLILENNINNTQNDFIL